MKLVVTDETLITRNTLPIRLKEDFDDCKVYPFTSSEELLPRIKDADAIFINRVSVSSEVLRQCKNLKYIGIFATGYNLVDINTAKELGITVCNVPDYSSYAVAQHAMALLLEVFNRVSVLNDIAKSGNWNDESIIKVPLTELYGKTLGIIGYGNIGSTFAKMAESMGMKILAYREHPDFTDGVEYTTLENLYKKSDVISLHCPLTDKTRKMINSSAISLMKDGAVLINTARGAILDQEAVVEALDNRKLSMVAVDVFETEPPSVDNPLLNHPRSIVTPHVAWAPTETRKRLIEITIDNFYAYLNGTPQNVVV